MHPHTPDPDNDELSFRPQFTQHGEVGEVPRLRLGDKGMPPRVAYQIIHDELMLDGNARLNLATFVTTWMEPEAELLMAECSSKNMIDKDEYPQTAEIERRCVNILARLWHAEGDERDRVLDDRLERGVHARWPRPQVALAAAAPPPGCRPRETESRHGCERPGLLGEVLPLLRRRGPPGPGGTRYRPPDPARARSHRATRTQSAWWRSSDRPTTVPTNQWPRSPPPSTPWSAGGGPDVPMHVDGASGALVAPFLDPKLSCGTSACRGCQSINVSGHKYGLVYPGVGWIAVAGSRSAAGRPRLQGQLPRR